MPVVDPSRIPFFTPGSGCYLDPTKGNLSENNMWWQKLRDFTEIKGEGGYGAENLDFITESNAVINASGNPSLSAGLSERLNKIAATYLTPAPVSPFAEPDPSSRPINVPAALLDEFHNSTTTVEKLDVLKKMRNELVREMLMKSILPAYFNDVRFQTDAMDVDAEFHTEYFLSRSRAKPVKPRTDGDTGLSGGSAELPTGETVSNPGGLARPPETYTADNTGSDPTSEESSAEDEGDEDAVESHGV